MSEAPLLYKLQTIDLDIEETSQALQDVESQLGESEELIAARSRVAILKDRRHQLESALKEAEWDIDKTQAQIKPLEEKLYGGTVKVPKELSSLEKEIGLLRGNKTKAEDRALEIMSEMEDLQDEIDQASAALASVEATWKVQQEELQGEKKRLSIHLEQAEREKQALVGTISQAALQTYEGLRRTRRGRAVALVERNTCQGCRVALPMQEVIRARTNQELSFCSSCGRIILVAR